MTETKNEGAGGTEEWQVRPIFYIYQNNKITPWGLPPNKQKNQPDVEDEDEEASPQSVKKVVSLVDICSMSDSELSATTFTMKPPDFTSKQIFWQQIDNHMFIQFKKTVLEGMLGDENDGGSG